jgi:chromosome segregation ATPase
MSEEVIEEGTPSAIEDDQIVDTDSVIMSSKDVVTESASEITEDIIEEVKEEVEIENEIKPAMEEVITAETTPPAETVVALSEEVVTSEQAGVPLVDYTAEIAELKVSLSSATTTMETLSVQLASASSKIKELDAALVSTKVELSSKIAENAEYKKTIDELQSKIKTIEEKERNNIISKIKSIDPEVDMTLISSMTTVQLSTYKSTLDRFINKGLFAEKKSIKVDEPVKLSAIEDVSLQIDRHDVAVGIVPYLKRQQRQNYSKF